MPDVRAELERLLTKQQRAAQRVNDVESEARTAAAAAQAASEAMVEAERRGVRASERAELEAQLSEARARAGQPWSERLEGARAALRDATTAVRSFQAANLDALVSDLEAYGRGVAQNIDGAARAIIEGHHERERVAQEIAALATSVGRTRPGDVSRTRADQVARAAAELIEAGGERPPTLERDPREPRYGTVAEQTSPVTA